MSLSAAVLEALFAEGLDGAAIVRVARAQEAEEAAEKAADLEAKRANNAARQRRFKASRARKGNAGNASNALPLPPNEEVLTPPRETPTNPSGLVPPKPKKHRLPDDWEPLPFKAGSQAALILVRWEPGRMERELAKFRAHYAAAGTRWENWQLVWAKWVNNAADFERGNSGGQHQHHSGIGRTSAAMLSLGDWHDERPM